MSAQCRDDVDALAQHWVPTRRELLGLSNPARARAYLGAPRCTLAERRDLHAGARSSGRVEQHFPEVYTGPALVFARAFKLLPEQDQRLIDVFYLIRQPAEAKSAFLGMSRRTYYAKVDAAKAYLRGVLAALDQQRAA